MKVDKQGKSSIDRALEYIKAREQLSILLHQMFTGKVQVHMEEIGVTDIQIILRDNKGEQIDSFSFIKKNS